MGESKTYFLVCIFGKTDNRNEFEKNHVTVDLENLRILYLGKMRKIKLPIKTWQAIHSRHPVEKCTLSHCAASLCMLICNTSVIFARRINFIKVIYHIKALEP